MFLQKLFGFFRVAFSFENILLVFFELCFFLLYLVLGLESEYFSFLLLWQDESQFFLFRQSAVKAKKICTLLFLLKKEEEKS